MPRFNPPTGATTSTTVTVASGRIAPPGMLPFRIAKDVLPNGKTRYSVIVLDGGAEKVIANADF